MGTLSHRLKCTLVLIRTENRIPGRHWRQKAESSADGLDRQLGCKALAVKSALCLDVFKADEVVAIRVSLLQETMKVI